MQTSFYFHARFGFCVFFSNVPYVSVSGDFYIAELFDLHRGIASMFV